MANDSQANGSRTQAELPVPGSNGHTFNGFGGIANFIWSVADLLRGDYKQADYGKVILPLTVLRRLDCVLDADEARRCSPKAEALKGGKVDRTSSPVLNRITGVPFHNTSKLDFEKLKGDPNHIAANLHGLHQGLLAERPRHLHRAVRVRRSRSRSWTETTCSSRSCPRFAEVDLHPETVPNHAWGSSSRS